MYIVGSVEIGEHGIAMVYSVVVIGVMVLALVGIRWLVGEQRIGRRAANTGATPTAPIGLSA